MQGLRVGYTGTLWGLSSCTGTLPPPCSSSSACMIKFQPSDEAKIAVCCSISTRSSSSKGYSHISTAPLGPLRAVATTACCCRRHAVRSSANSSPKTQPPQPRIRRYSIETASTVTAYQRHIHFCSHSYHGTPTPPLLLELRYPTATRSSVCGGCVVGVFKARMALQWQVW